MRREQANVVCRQMRVYKNTRFLEDFRKTSLLTSANSFVFIAISRDKDHLATLNDETNMLIIILHLRNLMSARLVVFDTLASARLLRLLPPLISRRRAPPDFRVVTRRAIL